MSRKKIKEKFVYIVEISVLKSGESYSGGFKSTFKYAVVAADVDEAIEKVKKEQSLAKIERIEKLQITKFID